MPAGVSGSTLPASMMHAKLFRRFPYTAKEISKGDPNCCLLCRSRLQVSPWCGLPGQPGHSHHDFALASPPYLLLPTMTHLGGFAKFCLSGRHQAIVFQAKVTSNKIFIAIFLKSKPGVSSLRAGRTPHLPPGPLAQLSRHACAMSLFRPFGSSLSGSPLLYHLRLGLSSYPVLVAV